MNEKKIEILNKAAVIFMQLGIKSVTMDELANQLGISKKTLYLHFKDKNDLICSIIEFKSLEDKEQCFQYRHEGCNSIDEMLAIGRFIMESFAKVNPVLFFDIQKYHPKAMLMIQEHKWKFVHSTIKENIEKGMKEGLYRSDLDPAFFASLYVTMTDALFGFSADFQAKKSMSSSLFDTIIFFIHGLASQKGYTYLTTQINK